MKLHSLKIDGFRRIKSAEVLFGDATFLIGPNNAGKSTVLKAVEWLLSAKKSIPSSEYFSVIDNDTGETKPAVDTITFTAEFRDLPTESKQWRGFKGRIFTYPTSDTSDSGLSVTYKKTFTLAKDVIIEVRSKERQTKAEFSKPNTAQDLIDNGASPEEVQEQFPDLNTKIGANKSTREKLELIDSIWDTKETEVWFQNPGGIPGVVLKMLPRFLLIPADTSSEEIEGTSGGVLGKTLNELFEDVRSASKNYAQAQDFFRAIALEHHKGLIPSMAMRMSSSQAARLRF